MIRHLSFMSDILYSVPGGKNVSVFIFSFDQRRYLIFLLDSKCRSYPFLFFPGNLILLKYFDPSPSVLKSCDVEVVPSVVNWSPFLSLSLKLEDLLQITQSDEAKNCSFLYTQPKPPPGRGSVVMTLSFPRQSRVL